MFVISFVSKSAFKQCGGNIECPDRVSFCYHVCFFRCYIGNPRAECCGNRFTGIECCLTNCLPYRRHQYITFIIMVETLELCGPQLNQIDHEVRPNEMHEIIGKGNGEREGR